MPISADTEMKLEIKSSNDKNKSRGKTSSKSKNKNRHYLGPKLAFGISKDRWDQLGIHPELGGVRRKDYNLSPGQYGIPGVSCLYKKFLTESWERKRISEEWSKNIGFFNPEQLEKRKILGSLRGPGSYDIDESIFKQKTSNVRENISFGLQKRFFSLAKDSNPPPGTYSGNWLKRPFVSRKSFSKTPTFEYDGFIDRFRGKSKSWSMPPNIYRVTDQSGIDALIRKRVSLRGPYDLFTGPRDGSTIKGYFAPSKDKPPEEFFKTYPSEMDKLLQHPVYVMKGKFFSCKRWDVKPSQRNILFDLSICYKDPREPGPANYAVTNGTIKEGEPNKAPFNQSVRYAKQQIKWHLSPGVGRYYIKESKCVSVKRKSWIFLSKIKRPEFKAVEYNAF